MPAENAIELFNCSLCSFCETSLDGLASHIRKHIKPEPSSTKEVTTPPANRHVSRANSINNLAENSFRQLNGNDSFAPSPVSSALPINYGNSPKDSSSCINQPKDIARSIQSSSVSNYQTNETNHLSPRMEMMDKRLVPPGNPHLQPIDPQKSSHVAAASKGEYMHSPIMQEKSPFSRNAPSQPLHRSNSSNVSPLSRPDPIIPPSSRPDTNVQTPIRSDHNIPQPTRPDHNIPQSTRPDNVPQVTRYIQLNPREHPTYVDINSVRPPFANQYVANINGKPAFVHSDLVPMAPSAKNGYPEMQSLPIDGHKNHPRDPFYRNMPPSERPTTPQQKNNTSTPYGGSHNNGNQGNRSHMTNNGDGRFRASLPYELVNQNNIHYQARPPMMPQDNTRGNFSTEKKTKFHHFYPDVRSPLPPPPYAAPPVKSTPPKPSPVIQGDTQVKQYENQLNSMQLSDIQKKHPQMVVPNNGTMITNPDQLLSIMGNPNLDELAGLLIVPLKKTMEAACQTDPVEFSNSDERKNNNCSSRSMQTELNMNEITETQHTEPLFESVRSCATLFECLVCGDEFASDHHLQQHTSKEHRHTCEKCSHASSNIHDHNVHITDCGQKNIDIICVDCNSIFPSLKKMHQHRGRHHNVRMPFRCGICSLPFESHESVMKHISTHDQDIPQYKCKHCVKIFQSTDALNKHFARHKKVEIFHECRFCKSSFTTHQLLQEHISYAHVIKETLGINETSYAAGSPARIDTMRNNRVINQKKYPLCRHCDLAFKTADHMKRHIRVCSKNSDATVTAFTCDICKEYLPSEEKKRQHLKKEHQRNSGFRCPKCSKIYRTWSRLKFHTKQQHIKKTCPDCNMVFTKEHVLRKHQEEEHGKPQGQPGERVYTCSYCNTMLNSLADLMTHRKEVHPELAQMKTIDKTIDRASNGAMLSSVDKNSSMETEGESGMNSQSHGASKVSSTAEASGESTSSLECDKCGSVFEDETRLKNHKGLIHGEKLFSCTECRKSFQYSSQVIWHLRTHRKKDVIPKVSSKLWKAKNKKTLSVSAAAPYICQFCGARFTQEKLLNNHKGSAHKIKLFSCHICEFKCGHSTELIWHVRTCRAKFKRKNPGVDVPARDKKAARIEEEDDDEDDDGDDDDDDDDSTTGGDGYVCYLCDNVFTVYEEYQIHMKTHPDEEVVLKEEKKENDIDIDETSTEQQGTDDDEKDDEELVIPDPEYDDSLGEYVCSVCQKTTKSMTGMKTHYGRVHGMWGKETSHKNGKGEHLIWPCKNCDREFSSLGSLRHHSTLIHGFSVEAQDVEVVRPGVRNGAANDEERFSCPYCSIWFTTSKAIRVHAFKKHGTVLSDEEVIEWRTGGHSKPPGTTDQITKDNIRFKCTKCKSKFSTGKAIRIHSLKEHNLVLSFDQITKCKIRIGDGVMSHPSPPPMNKTKAKVLDDNVYPCDECGRIFANYRAFFTHYRQAHPTLALAQPGEDDKNLPEDETGSPASKEVPTEDGGMHPDDDSDATLAAEGDESYIEGDPNTPPTKNRTEVVTKSYPVRDRQEDRLKSEKKTTIDCPKCDRTYSQNKSFLTHIHTVHRISKDDYAKYWPDGLPTLTREKVRCPTCQRECVNDRAMRIHFFQAHGILYSDVMKKNFEIPTEEEFDEELNQLEDDPASYDENELRVVEDDNTTPTCFICGRLFRNRRAVMTHEYKYHGIRWVGTKRIFPERVRNIPNMVPVTPTSTSRSDRADRNTLSKEDPSTSTGYPLSGADSLTDSPFVSGEVKQEFTCPLCGGIFHGRRSITTHLCRIHKYRKNELRAFFAELAANSNPVDDPSLPVEGNPLETSVATDTTEKEVSPVDSDLRQQSVDSDRPSDTETQSQEKTLDGVLSREGSLNVDSPLREQSLNVDSPVDPSNHLREQPDLGSQSNPSAHLREQSLGVHSPLQKQPRDTDSPLDDGSTSRDESLDADRLSREESLDASPLSPEESLDVDDLSGAVSSSSHRLSREESLDAASPLRKESLNVDSTLRQTLVACSRPLRDGLLVIDSPSRENLLDADNQLRERLLDDTAPLRERQIDTGVVNQERSSDVSDSLRGHVLHADNRMLERSLAVGNPLREQRPLNMSLPVRERSQDIDNQLKERSLEVGNILDGTITSRNTSSNIDSPFREQSPYVDSPSHEQSSGVDSPLRGQSSGVDSPLQEHSLGINRALGNRLTSLQEQLQQRSIEQPLNTHVQSRLGNIGINDLRALPINNGNRSKTSVDSEVDSPLQGRQVGMNFDDFGVTDPLRNRDARLSNDVDNLSEDSMPDACEAKRNDRGGSNLQSCDLEGNDDIETYDDMDDELGEFSLFSGEYNVEM